MNSKTKTGLQILETALILGVLGDALLRVETWGLNLLLWIVALVMGLVGLTLRRRREFWTKQTIALHVAVIFFAALFVWRDSATLQTLDVLLILSILSILTLPALDIKPQISGFLHYFAGALYSSFSAIVAPFVLIFGDIEWAKIPQNGFTKHLAAILRGLAIAAPILFVFGLLFMAADAVFEGIVKNTLHIEGGVLFSHFLLFGFLTWISAGYLRGAIGESLLTTLGTNPSTNAQQSLGLNDVKVDENAVKANPNQVLNKDETSEWSSFFTLGAVEMSIVLGLVNALFLGFVIIQIRYFFGGMELVQATENFKLSDYARRGFGEIVTVAALMLPILLVTHWLLRKDNKLNEKLFRVFALVNIGLLFVMMYSALQRMLLYTSDLGYGLSELRIYTTAFMLWLAIVFVWFGLTVLRGQTHRFAWGAMWTAFLVVASLHVLNPDNLIVRTNVKLSQQGRTFDARYLTNLSDDAVPALTEALPTLSFD
ncbi:MAG: DUF4173 domain-containing protein, partial [Pyrinomonadaceae bacterium]|nr:DUF4173 domain-containing protein [Pyrinomonadaceae bacterium]